MEKGSKTKRNCKYRLGLYSSVGFVVKCCSSCAVNDMFIWFLLVLLSTGEKLPWCCFALHLRFHPQSHWNISFFQNPPIIRSGSCHLMTLLVPHPLFTSNVHMYPLRRHCCLELRPVWALTPPQASGLSWSHCATRWQVATRSACFSPEGSWCYK